MEIQGGKLKEKYSESL